MAVIEDPNKIIEGPNIITREDYPEGYTGAMLSGGNAALPTFLTHNDMDYVNYMDRNLTPEQVAIADINSDGIVDILDIVQLVNLILNPQSMQSMLQFKL